ncbi:aminotransferase class I/II-fold pyridoxal phosphate-dependent enzyme [Agreia sp. COWG]|uniref:aminotransferase class I/II-fold pyridoxal phosphate-dependent enzyme n=1 Tax=Agreia sp. COWG TaxID=2773266 RepID=UPI0019274308|nr:Aminotransferase [Agreia sp. COWG]
MPQLASHIDFVPPSGIRRIFEMALTLPDVLMLAVGEPDVRVAPSILAAGSEAWLADKTNYTPNGGILPLREALVRKLARDNNVVVDTEQVWVTSGGMQGLYLAMSLCLGPGDEVLIPDPGYSTFAMNAAMISAVAVPYPLRRDNAFLPDLDELGRLVTDRTRMIIINSPSNPLGAIFPEETLRALVDFARQHDLWILSDEVYEAFTYEAPHVSVASLDGDDRVFSVFSLSKTYALTGARVGYLVTPSGLSATMRTAQEAMISCVNTPAQLAALAAVEGDQRHIVAAAAHYRQNLDAATELLRRRGIEYLQPSGAFYLWINVGYATQGDVAGWGERFLLTERVAVAPGSAFGRGGEGWIRICVAASEADLLEAIRRLPEPPARVLDADAARRQKITVRLAEPHEYEAIGRQRLDAYRLEFTIDEDYASTILDVPQHAATGEVWVAVDDSSGRILGSVTTPRPGELLTPLGRAGEFDFRLLAVDPAARGRRVGSILTDFVIELARQRGAERIVMHSGTDMITAHGLYERRGFSRMPDRENPPGIEPSRAYGLDL